MSTFLLKVKRGFKYQLAKHHARQNKKLSTVCTTCLEEIQSFNSLQRHKRRKHGTSTKVGTKSSEKLKEELESEKMDQINEQLQQELCSCQHFDNTEIENGRYRLFNFKLSKLDLSEIIGKLKEVFEKLNCAAKINLSSGIYFTSIGNRQIKIFLSHENTFFERSHLLCSKGDLVSLRERVEKMDLVETRKRKNKIAVCTHYERDNFLCS